MLEIKKDGDKNWSSCFTYPKPIDYPTHTYISSGGSSQGMHRGITINSIKFYDNEVDLEGADLIEPTEKE